MSTPWDKVSKYALRKNSKDEKAVSKFADDWVDDDLGSVAARVSTSLAKNKLGLGDDETANYMKRKGLWNPEGDSPWTEKKK